MENKSSHVQQTLSFSGPHTSWSITQSVNRLTNQFIGHWHSASQIQLICLDFFIPIFPGFALAFMIHFVISWCTIHFVFRKWSSFPFKHLAGPTSALEGIVSVILGVVLIITATKETKSKRIDMLSACHINVLNTHIHIIICNSGSQLPGDSVSVKHGVVDQCISV